MSARRIVAGALAGLACAAWAGAPAMDAGRHPVPAAHPRLLGTAAELRTLARQRAADYRRMAAVGRDAASDLQPRLISMALTAAIEDDAALARQAQRLVMERFVQRPIRRGHVPFGTDLALGGLVYDLCHAAWSPEERRQFHDYVNATVDANVASETHVFHNAWYGYKNWGIGVAAYATYGENPRAAAILQTLEADYRQRAAPALERAGAGGGWAEGYYIHYWLLEWLMFCEVARRCEGVDYYAAAPAFYGRRALASVFEMQPGLSDYGSRRPIPMGDGGGRRFGGDRDKALSARRILAAYFHDDPVHRAVRAFDAATPRSSVGQNAWMDFLWHDPAAPRGRLDDLGLSHHSRGPGYVYARSDWTENATHFFFKCGDRFTAHQHLDVGHFLIFKRAELAGDGGHYDEFGTAHDVNYHLRTIAHSTVLVHDPGETWPAIRGGRVTANDGGQHHAWRHHNGAAADPEDWERQRAALDIADLLAFEDRGEYLYVAGDATRAYASNKLERFTRQIVYLRPDTFVIYDQVTARKPGFRKTWLLQAMRPPMFHEDRWLMTNGPGRLIIQTLLPEAARTRLVTGEELYTVDGRAYPPGRDTGPAPACCMEVSPPAPRREDQFLHVLTAGVAGEPLTPPATWRADGDRIEVSVAGAVVRFDRRQTGGDIRVAGRERPLAARVEAER